MISKEALYKFIRNINSNKPNVVISLRDVEIIKELVERDTPKKPLLVEISAENIHHYDCSSCNTNINIGDSIGYNKVFNRFCKECGQRLDWKEEENDV